MGSTSRRTENVNYESSRVVRKTRIPQGIVKRLSVSVLVGQDSHWEGAGKARHRVFVPPPPETLKTIKDLVSAVTGLNAERGDQLIVDSLPFEAMMKDEPPSAVPAPGTTPSNQPADWREMLKKYWTWILIAVLGLGVLAIIARSLTRRPRKELEEEITIQKTLAKPDSVPEIELPQAAYSPVVESAAAKPAADIVERVRLLTEQDLNAATTVLRSWLHEQKAHQEA